MKLSVAQFRAGLRAPLRTAHGTVAERHLAVLTLSDDDSGLRGHGEAAPLTSYDGVGIDDVLAGIDACRELLEDADLATVTHRTARGSLIGECARRAALPQALAAIDLALHDLAARAAELPVFKLLGAPTGDEAGAGAGGSPVSSPPAIAVNHTIAALDPAAAAREAQSALAAGFGTVKVKVGLGSEQDRARVAAVRAGGGERLAIRLDANGAWGSVEAASRALGELIPYGIELCEEPLRGAALVERLAAEVPLALALDESAAEPLALQRRCAQAICLKISRCGGIAGVIRDAARARELGYEVYLASTLDGPLGIAAALHAAALISVDRPCGLATLALFADPRDPSPAAADPLPAAAGRMAPPATPGLGDGLIAFYSHLSSPTCTEAHKSL